MKLFESHVLILDEDLAFGQELKRQLCIKSNTEVNVYNSVIDCLNGVQTEPDIVFIQHKMSHIDGIRASRMLKRKWKHTRIVLMCMSHSLNKRINKKKFGISKAMLKTNDYHQYVREARRSRMIALGKKLFFVTLALSSLGIFYFLP